jgi:hypothetical protein
MRSASGNWRRDRSSSEAAAPRRLDPAARGAVFRARGRLRAAGFAAGFRAAGFLTAVFRRRVMPLRRVFFGSARVFFRRAGRGRLGLRRALRAGRAALRAGRVR